MFSHIFFRVLRHVQKQNQEKNDDNKKNDEAIVDGVSRAFIQSTHLGKIFLRFFFSATTICPKVPSSLLSSYLLYINPFYTTYSKMATILVFFCLTANWPIWPDFQT